MLIAMCLKCAVMIGLLGPGPAKGTPRFSIGPGDRLPTPREMNDEVNGRMLKGARELLEVTRDLRKDLEQRTNGDYSEDIAQLKKREAQIQGMIDQMEHKLRNPPPAVVPLMPIIPREGPKPPPRKD